MQQRVSRMAWVPMVLTVTLSVFVAGCGGGSDHRPVGTVVGTVTLDGQPLSEGRVVFVSEALGASAMANLTENGSFELDGSIPAGEYQVYLAPPDQGDAPPALTVDPRQKNALAGVPEKYLSQTASDLKVSVTEGSNVLPIELSSR